MSYYFSPGFLDKSFNAVTRWHFRFASFGDDNSSSQVCHYKAMRDVLMVISYVEITFEKISAIEDLYSERFPNILFCGAKRPETGSRTNMMVINVQRGITAYGCLAGALKSYPKYKGYLFIKSEVLVNFWRLSELNFARIWHTPTLSGQAMFEQSRDPWIWWYTPWGLKACEKAYKRIIFLNSLEKRKAKTVDDVDSKSTWEIESSLNALLWNGRGRYRCYRGDANIFYIPAKYANEFESMAQIFSDYGVFMDIAVATIITMLELKEYNTLLDGTDLGMLYGEERATWDTRLFLEHVNSSLSFIRPLFPTNSGYYRNHVKEIRSRLDEHEPCAQES